MHLSLLHEESKGWIGVDLDGTAAEYDHFRGHDHIGKPIPKMINRIKRWIRDGKKVKIFTARADLATARGAIKDWCRKHIGQVLPITNKKDRWMVRLYDDRCRKVLKNTGKLA